MPHVLETDPDLGRKWDCRGPGNATPREGSRREVSSALTSGAPPVSLLPPIVGPRLAEIERTAGPPTCDPCSSFGTSTLSTSLRRASPGSGEPSSSGKAPPLGLGVSSNVPRPHSAWVRAVQSPRNGLELSEVLDVSERSHPTGLSGRPWLPGFSPKGS